MCLHGVTITLLRAGRRRAHGHHVPRADAPPDAEDAEDVKEEEDDPVGSIDDYMLKFVEADWEFFGA